jgi:SAM-dependent methyltransferase
MKNYFGKEIAKDYDDDEVMNNPSVVDPAVDFLANLARGGAALEFGIGTGRIALPLSRKGIDVCGIDFSPDMVEQLQLKRGADSIGVHIGDFATAKVQGSFQLVYLVFNTITNLTTQDAQVECFRNAAAHLKPGGCFVIETFIPQLRLLPPGETIRPHHFSQSRLDFDEYNVATQGLVSHHYRNVNGAFQIYFLPFRYVWPSELDLMARMAGMRLRERWSDWNRQPFTNESTSHISVWEKLIDI